MSLINKMLQDLDARGSQSDAVSQPEIKPVLAPETALPVRQIALGATTLVVAMAVAGWWWVKRPQPVAPLAPLPMQAQVPVPGLAPIPAPASAPVPAPAPPAVTDTPAPPVPPSAVVSVPAKPRATPRPRTHAIAQQARAVPAVVPGGREMTAEQRSERLYRDAIGLLDQGRVGAAMDTLEQTLKLNPRHDGARQSLVSLLVEEGRKEEAMQQLEQGLALDPGQQAMAMLLARMQIERGQSGVATLLRSLPAAAGHGDYHAFLAGALQRDGRNQEAVEHYAMALRTKPEQGVWLMGMGISLQAEKRDGDARAAYQRAKASGTLTPPLLEFVERKLLQLAP